MRINFVFILNAILIIYLDFSLIVSVFDNRTLGKLGCFDIDPLLNNLPSSSHLKNNYYY